MIVSATPTQKILFLVILFSLHAFICIYFYSRHIRRSKQQIMEFFAPQAQRVCRKN